MPPVVPSPVVRRQVAAFHMALFLDDLAAYVKAAQLARYRQLPVGVESDDTEAA